MSAIETFLRQPGAQAIGWALLQFVWQGAAVGALTAAALSALRRSACDVRYVVAVIGLALMMTLPVVTAAQRYAALTQGHGTLPSPSSPSPGAIERAPRTRSGDSADTAHPPEGPRAPVITRRAAAAGRAVGGIRLPGIGATPPDGRQNPSLDPRTASALMLAWLAGVAALTLRLMTGWLWVQRIRTHGIAAAEPVWERTMARLARQLRVTRTVALFESPHVDVPTVIGWMKPVVLLPASALGGLAPSQLEAILAHELAHIRRHDYLVNLLQTLIETLLFYHPVVWWLSSRIRTEREHCCDDLAVSLCGDPIAYANALADLESLRSPVSPFDRVDRMAMAATGGALLHRIRRLLGAPASHAGRGPAWLAASVALLLVAGIALGADGFGNQQNASPAPGPSVPRSPVASRPAAAPSSEGAGKRTPAAKAFSAERSSEGEAAVMPATPAPPAPPALPATPTAASVQGAAGAGPGPIAASTSQSGSHTHGKWVWSDNGEKLQVEYSGAFEFTDDDADVKEMSSGGSLKISDGAWFGRHSVEIAERGGRLERRYFVNGAERPFEPDGRDWMRQNLPRFVRNTGIAAPSRVARLLKAGGPAAVLAEIDRIDGNHARGIYYRELFTQTRLTPEQYRQVLTQAAREMRGSDYELGQLLIAVADRLPVDEASRAAYFTAASALSSAYESRRVYTAMIQKGPVPAGVVGAVLEHAKAMRSDYDLSEVLRLIIARQGLDSQSRTAFFDAVGALRSDYERHRVLSAVMSSPHGSDPAVLQSALVQAGRLSSDYDAASFLLEVLRQNGVEGPMRSPFFAVVANLKSGHERGRVLQALARRSDASHDTLKSVLQATGGLSGYELSQVLVTIAAAHPLTGDLRDAYVDAADRLSSYEQGQAMTALVRSERRR